MGSTHSSSLANPHIRTKSPFSTLSAQFPSFLILLHYGPKIPLVTPLPTDSDPEVIELAKFFNETLGYCPNSVLTVMRPQPIAKAFISLNMAVMENKGRVTSALKRLVGYIASNAAGCRYCQAHAIRAAERYGAEQEQLENIWEYRTHPAFNEAERVALGFALTVSTIPIAVNDDALQSRLHEHWDNG